MHHLSKQFCFVCSYTAISTQTDPERKTLHCGDVGQLICGIEGDVLCKLMDSLSLRSAFVSKQVLPAVMCKIASPDVTVYLM
jgi:hypothetical protein